VSGLRIRRPGALSLLQDGGRYGQHRIGLTTGGPADRLAFAWANRLVHNEPEVTAIEASFGGLELDVETDTLIAVTGGDQSLSINGIEVETWRSHRVEAGDLISLGYAHKYCRSYLAARGGFHIEEQFGSTATVVREGIGGIDGNKLREQELLPCATDRNSDCLQLAEADRPQYSNEITVRVIPGYQEHSFSRLQQRRFFSGHYQVSDRADRMGYRLEGPVIECEIDGILSEGICMGAIQIPADGQPIVLLQDRQTIGGYPKIGSALSLDTAKLAQLMPGGKVRFEPVTPHYADNAFHLAHSRFHRVKPETVNG